MRRALPILILFSCLSCLGVGQTSQRFPPDPQKAYHYIETLIDFADVLRGMGDNRQARSILEQALSELGKRESWAQSKLNAGFWINST